MSANPSDVRELVLFIENDADLYRQRTMPIVKNLLKKIRKGTYKPELSVKLWKYLADDGAKKYGREFGNNDGLRIFSVADRQAAARELAQTYETMILAGEFSMMEKGFK